MGDELARRALEEALRRSRNGQRTKLERAQQLVAESQAKQWELFGGLTPGRCGFCNNLAFTYRPPAIMQWKCRCCHNWNRIIDEAGVNDP